MADRLVKRENNAFARRDHPNVMLVLTDQQSAAMMSCAGNRHLRTPAMDRLAAEGVRFERAYCTNPVCVPSRFSLMTGLMPSAIGMFSNSVADVAAVPAAVQEQGLGWLLRRAGHETVYGGKVHLPRMGARHVGFEPLCLDDRDGLADFCVEFLHRRREAPFFLVASFSNPHDICYMAIRESLQSESERQLMSRPEGRAASRTLDDALGRLAGTSDEELLAAGCPPRPANFEPQEDEPEAIRILLESRPFRMRARHRWNERRWREHRWAYARLTELVDAQIGRMLEALRESGEDENTLIVFTSDHGDMDAAHRMEHKSALYEEACRIPLIVRPPGGMRVARVESARLVSNGLDVLPTICDYAGVEPPAGRAGLSLRPLVDGREPESWRKWLPIESVVGRAVVAERFKYAVYDVGMSQEQLVDLVADPGETRNSLPALRKNRVAEDMRRAFREAFGGQPRDPAALARAMTEA